MKRVALPPQLVQDAQAYAAGTREAVEPRPAATVILMRSGSGDDGPEVYLLRRQTTMAFAGGMCVFPGGGVDKRDFDHATAWAGPSPAEWATQLGVDEANARALVCAAVRETFEESGVLLAGESPDSVVADTTGEDWERDRAALESRELAFTDFLDRRGLVLRTDLLGVWSAWQTPVFEPRRFRAWFFVADLPEGQRTRDVSTESVDVTWMPALEAVRQVEAEQIMMMPPTWVTCLQVGQHASPAEAIAATRGRTVEVFMPELTEDDEGYTLSAPPGTHELLEARG